MNERARGGSRSEPSEHGPSGRRWSRVAAAVVALLVVGSVVGAVVPSGATTPSTIDSCTAITEPGSYTLSSDLESDGGVCLSIRSSDVRIDGNGHTVAGDGDGVGVRTTTDGVSNVTVANLTATGWVVGVHLRHVEGGAVRNVTAVDNTEGIALFGSSDLQVRRNVVRGNDHQGMRVVQTTDSLLVVNTAFENVADGFVVRRSPNNTLRANVASRNGDDVGADGFHVNKSDRTTLVRNAGINNTDDGIEVEQSSGSRVIGNNVSFNVGLLNSDGLELRHSTDLVVRNNAANGNVDDGIDLKYVNRSLVVDNVANRNVNDGIPIARSHHNVVRDNVASENTQVDREITDHFFEGREVEETESEGITLRSGASNNTIVDNTIRNNHRQGIRVWLHAPRNTVTNNTVVGNGGDGIAVFNSTDNTVRGNDIRTNDGNGVHLNNDAAHNTLQQNRIAGNRLSGILAVTANGTRIVGNLVTGNGGGPEANGIRISRSEDVAVVNSPTFDNENAQIQIVRSDRIHIVDSSEVATFKSGQVTEVDSWLHSRVIPTARNGSAG